MGQLPTPGFFPFSRPGPADSPAAWASWASFGNTPAHLLGGQPALHPAAPALLLPYITRLGYGSHYADEGAQSPREGRAHPASHSKLVPENPSPSASALTHQEPASRGPCPANKKKAELKTDVLSDPSENRGLGAKCLRQTWRDKQMQCLSCDLLTWSGSS